MILVIPSGNQENLNSCLDSVFTNESLLPPSNIFVVTDGDIHAKDVNVIKGERPFIFSRNVNFGLLVARSSHNNLVVMSDDAILKTPNGLSMLESSDGYSIVSPGIDGECGNHNQVNQGRSGIVPETKVLCFICVLIKHEAIRKVGLMDERFIGYGYDDVDYSRRTLQQGLKMGVMDAVKIVHKGHSVFRNQTNFADLSEMNRKIYLDKWSGL